MTFCCLQHLRKRLKMLGHPMNPARIRKELNAVQLSILRRKGTGERYAMPSQAKPRDHRCKTHSDMRWPDLERDSLPDAAGTDAQNRPDQRLKQTTVWDCIQTSLRKERCSAFLTPDVNGINAL